MVHVVEATAILEAPKVEESLGSRLKGLFGGGKNGDEGEAEAEILEKIVEEDEKKAEEERKEKEKANGTAAEDKKEDKLVEKLVPLKVAVEAGEVKAMTTEEKNASRTRSVPLPPPSILHCSPDADPFSLEPASQSPRHRRRRARPPRPRGGPEHPRGLPVPTARDARP